MASVTISQDDTYTYFEGTGFDSREEVNAEIKSQATPPNTSTEGVGAGMHKTSDPLGNVKFRVPTDFLLPDLPREVSAKLWTELTTVTETFS